MNNNKTPAALQEEFQLTLSTISHEIRNPITLINSFLDLLVSKHPEVETFEYWDDIIENMDFLKELLNELSDYNNAGKLRLQETNLPEFIKHLTDSMVPTLHYLNIQIRFLCTREFPALMIDPLKVKEAILNIVRNASEAIEGSGIVSVELTADNTYAYVSIANDGPAIPMEDLKTLFQPFITHKRDGTGLGLAITHQIMKAHGGYVTVTSENQKTNFVLAFPFAPDRQELQAENRR